MDKKRMQGFVSGMLTAVIISGGAALAKSSVENINVTYDNIKVYVDNVLTELKDANGTKIEPFIYNGTTYMPVRGTAAAAGMQVTWDGATKSVYLWDNLMPESAKFLDYCPPYETGNYTAYIASNGKSFQMNGVKYTDGFSLNWRKAYALFNLDGKYSSINFTMGHIDGSDMRNRTVMFFVDGELVREIEVGCEDLAKTYSIPVNYGLQLKILCSDDNNTKTGFANISVR